MINQCLEILKREEFKKEFRQILAPLFSLLMEALRPYLICICMVIVFHTVLLMALFTKIFYK
jgi:hypothetical protein